MKFDENLIDVHIKKGMHDEEIIICKINQIIISEEGEYIGIDGIEIKNIRKQNFKLFRPVPILIEPQSKVVDLDD